MSDDQEFKSGGEGSEHPASEGESRLTGIARHLRDGDRPDSQRVADLLEQMDSLERAARSHLRLR